MNEEIRYISTRTIKKTFEVSAIHYDVGLNLGELDLSNLHARGLSEVEIDCIVNETSKESLELIQKYVERFGFVMLLRQ